MITSGQPPLVPFTVKVTSLLTLTGLALAVRAVMRPAALADKGAAIVSKTTRSDAVRVIRIPKLLFRSQRRPECASLLDPEDTSPVLLIRYYHDVPAGPST
jgi:hypothetical protein